MDIRHLCEEHTQALKAIRVQAARESPAAIYPTATEESDKSLREFREKLANGTYQIVLGAFEDGQLVGITGLKRERLEKLSHTAVLWGVYVLPDYRGRGIARRLVAAAVAVARTIPEVYQVKLCVCMGNQAARHVYEAEGFTWYGREPNVIRLGSHMFDEDLFILKIGEFPRSMNVEPTA